MAEMKVFVINLDEQEKDTGCAWFTLPCNIEALKQSISNTTCQSLNIPLLQTA